jgi:hypothetical protein
MAETLSAVGRSAISTTARALSSSASGYQWWAELLMERTASIAPRHRLAAVHVRLEFANSLNEEPQPLRLHAQLTLQTDDGLRVGLIASNKPAHLLGLRMGERVSQTAAAAIRSGTASE